MGSMIAARRLLLVVFCTLTGALVLPGAAALAVTRYIQVSRIGSSGELSSLPRGLAVSQSSGDLLVADGESVPRFAPVSRMSPAAGYAPGTALSGPFTNAFAVAVDDSGGLSQGDSYVVQLFQAALKFDPTGLPDASTPQLGAGATPLALGEADGVAVNPASGDVYIADYSNSVIDVFTPTGGFLSQFPTRSGPSSLAFNAAGSELYVVASDLGEIEQLSASGTPEDLTEGPNAGTNIVDDSGEAHAVALDTSNGDVYADDFGSVAVYAPSGAPLPQLGFQSGGGFSLGIAVDSGSHTVFVGDFSDGVVNVFALASLPGVSTGQASGVSETSATLAGAVNPEGLSVSACEFEYGTSTSYGQSAPCAQSPAELGSGNAAVPVSAAIAGLQPDTTYHYRLLASSPQGSEPGEDRTFSTFSPPVVLAQSVTGAGTSSVTLNATIDTIGLPSTYSFQYGLDPSYGSSTPPRVTAAGQGQVVVHELVTGLQPATTYHFRVQASNAYGAVTGADALFVTSDPLAAGLPDGRGYEMVSPVEDADGNVYEPTAVGVNPEAGNGDNTERPFQAAADGNAMAYTGDPGAGSATGSEGAGAGNQFLAERAPGGGWTASDIEPQSGSISEDPVYQAFSPDLSVGILDWNGRNALSAGAPAGRYHVLYARTSSDGSYHPLLHGTPPDRSFAAFGAYEVFHLGEGGLVFAGASADFTHQLFLANDALSAGALDGGETQNNLYDAVGGEVRLVNVLPDGSSRPGAIFGAPVVAASEESPGRDSPDFDHVISSDGSRIFWTDLSSGDLYVREDGTRTVQLDAGVGGGGRFWAASADGSRAFFTKGDLYEYDLADGHSTDLTPGGEVQGVLGVSEDGSYVYFVSSAALAPGASPQPCEQANPSGCNLYVIHRGEPARFIATLSSGDDHVRPLTLNDRLYGDWRPGLGNRTAAVTPDGRGLVFMSSRSLTGYQSNDLEEVYVYDTDSRRLTCVSCNPSGEAPAPLTLEHEYAAYLPPSYSNTYIPRWISEDASRVFFDSIEALLPQDTNGRLDVYEWERAGAGSCQRSGGCLYLLSGGTSPDNSYLADAGASGDDVFIITRAQLAAQDTNENFDVYDVRVGARQPLVPAQCAGTGCQGAAPTPAFALPASAAFSGPGNPRPASGSPIRPKRRTTACRRGFLKRHGRCVRHRQKKRKRTQSSAKGRK
jgi:sugar lactone lactonase YvrE